MAPAEREEDYFQPYVSDAMVTSYRNSVVRYHACYETRTHTPRERWYDIMRRAIAAVIERGEDALAEPGERGGEMKVSPGIRLAAIDSARAIREIIPLDRMRLGAILEYGGPAGYDVTGMRCHIDAIDESGPVAYVYAPVRDMSDGAIRRAARKRQWHVTAAMCKQLVETEYRSRAKVYFVAVAADPAEAGLVEIAHDDVQRGLKLFKTVVREIQHRRRMNDWGSRWRSAAKTISIP